MRRAGRVVAEHHHARRLGAAARHAEQQPHAQLLDLRLVEDLGLDADLARQRRGAPRELTRRQHVAGLVRELAREVAAFAEDASALDRQLRHRRRAVDIVERDDGPGRHRRGRRIVGLVAAAIELGERQPFGDRLRKIRGDSLPANHERRARHVALPRGQAAGGGQLPQQIGAALAASAADDRDAARAPARVGDRREEQLVRFGLEFLRQQRAPEFAAGRRVEIRNAPAVSPWNQGTIKRSASIADNGPLLQAIGVDDRSWAHPIIIADDACRVSPGAVQFACSSCRGEDQESWGTCEHIAWAGVASLLVMAALSTGASAQKTSKDGKDQKDANDPRPKVSLRAQPVIAMAPARVVFTAELTGGANDFEDFYCGAVEWEWGDGTKSESSSDCAPYEPGKSEIKRRFTVEHVFRAGVYRVMFHLKRHDKAVGNATINIQVRPGLRDGMYPTLVVSLRTTSAARPSTGSTSDHLRPAPPKRDSAKAGRANPTSEHNGRPASS